MARAITTLTKAESFDYYSTHDFGAALQVIGENPAAKGSETDFNEALISFRKTVYKDLASEVLSIGYYGDVVDEMLRLFPSEGHDVPLRNIGVKDEELLNLMLASPKKMMEYAEYLSDDTKAYFMHSVSEINANFGRKIAAVNPTALYQSVRDIYVEGGFDENPISKQYAFEYLQAMQTLAPTKIHTDLDPKEKFEPPKFDEQGQHVEQIVKDAPGQAM